MFFLLRRSRFGVSDGILECFHLGFRVWIARTEFLVLLVLPVLLVLFGSKEAQVPVFDRYLLNVIGSVGIDQDVMKQFRELADPEWPSMVFDPLESFAHHSAFWKASSCHIVRARSLHPGYDKGAPWEDLKGQPSWYEAELLQDRKRLESELKRRLNCTRERRSCLRGPNNRGSVSSSGDVVHVHSV